ncbi:hypothetical protein RD792_014943 [Penstemon davidsonii]|uniref:BHLH domain-containing protein n=1 Tax=Penstemon davidsonii TaxID=160366 RepID=A0ABR0CRN2_9LAMI|nr:hypothetical protein RD792_014943 [Penstemon davidsonii]
MELPQPRPFGAQGKKATHDFLSLYSSPVQQDSTTQQGGYLKTHDFLQPLELVGNNVAKEENKVGMITAIEKPSPQSVEHILPGGIGTYSISYFNQRLLKPEGNLFATAQASSTTKNDENSNCSSYSGSGFTLWDESAVNKGKTGKENILAERHILQEAGMNVVGGQWPPVMERNPQSSSNHKLNTATFTSFSSSLPSSSKKNQSFMDMITSAKNDQEEDDDDDDEEFMIKKEPSIHPKGHFFFPCPVFQNLREIIPNSEQKRDKASFLLEVIEYIQFLQEKVNKYESSYDVWNHEPAKMMPWRNSETAEGFIEHSHSQGINTAGSGPTSSVFPAKFDENKAVVESDISTTKQRDHHRAPIQPNIFSFGRANIAAASPKEGSECTADKPKDQEPIIESGTINISSAYSRGLLNNLTQALQSSGVDLSQASISVQIDLGKRRGNNNNAAVLNSTSSIVKDDDVVVANLARSRIASKGEEFEQALKRLRTS